MYRIAIVAPQSNLGTQNEILRSINGYQVHICDGNVDRAKLELFLTGQNADIVHFMGHGHAGIDIARLSDGIMIAKELATMLRSVAGLRLVILTACHSSGTAAAIHNALHVPVIGFQGDLEDEAAIRFSETFYRTYRAGSSLQHAFDLAHSVVAGCSAFPILIDGDMASLAEQAKCMEYVKAELGKIQQELGWLREAVDKLQAAARPNRVILVLFVLLLVVQILTPWLNHIFAG